MARTKAFNLAELIRVFKYNPVTAKVESTTTIETAGQARDTVVATNTSIITVDSWSTSAYRAAHYTVTATHTSGYHTTQMLVQHDGTITNDTEYSGLISNNSLATFTTDINSGNVRLRATPAHTNVTFQYKAEYIEI